MTLLDQLMALVRDGLLTCDRREHLRLFNYTPRCVYDGRWTPLTMQARGLVLDARTGAVVARPWPKFFNHDEPHAPIPRGLPCEVTVKMDGALGISYPWGDGIAWTTRGRFGSPQAAAANALWQRDHADVVVPERWTLLTEIVHPSSKVVVSYDYDGLVLLGIRTVDGDDFAHPDVRAWGRANGLRVVEPVVSRGVYDLKDRADALSEQHEGYVLRWGSGPDSHRVKVKGEAYKAVHRILDGLSDRRAGDIWYARAVLPTAVPEEARQFAEELGRELRFAAEDAEMEATGIVVQIEPGTSRKDVALAYKGHPLFPAIMRLFAGQDFDFRAHAYRERFGAKPRPVEGL